jgi:polysaccharide export outer membrane protein
MEGPLHANGTNGASKVAIQKHENSVVEESARMRTVDVKGSAFPGVDVDMSRIPGQEGPAPAPKTSGADAALQARLSEVESRLKALQTQSQPTPDQLASLEKRLAGMESKLAEVEGRPVQEVDVSSENYAELLDQVDRRVSALEGSAPVVDVAPEGLEGRLSSLESRVDHVEARAEEVLTVTPRTYEENIARLEGRIAELEQRPAQVVEATPENFQVKLEVLETKLAALEQRPPRTIEVTSDTQDQLLEEMQARLASLEGRPPQIVKITPENYQQELQALEARLAQIEGRPAQQIEVTETNYGEELAGVEARLAALETRPPQIVQIAPEKFGEELASIETRLAGLESAASAPDSLSAGYRAELAALEQRLAAIESVEVRTVLTAPDESTVRRLETMEGQLAEMRVAVDRQKEMEVTVPAVAGAPGPRQVDVHVETASVDDYLIGAGDILEFQSFNDETLNRPLTVRFDGHISLPLIPDQRVAGLSRQEAEIQVRNAYTRVFRDPQLALVVQTTTSKTFTVMGDVERPAHYPYLKNYTLLEAITEAGGLRNRNASSSVGGFIGVTGQLTKAYVIRREHGDRQVYEYDLRHLGQPGYHASEAPIFPGDLVYVPPGTNLVYVLGESRNPVIVELTEGMTMLQMLALSGGFNTSTAQLRNVVLIREVDDVHSDILNINVRALLKGGGRIPLQPGDIIYLPQKKLVRLQEFVSRITGSIAPWLDLYQSAVSSYYAQDLNEIIIDASEQSNTLRILGEIEQFGRSTDNIVNLYRSP